MTTSEPDPTVMTRFCHDVVPSMLTDGCGVNAPLASAIGADVLTRARSLAALADPVRDVLMTPFIEEVFDHDPRETTLEMKAAVTVVVRNSLFEEAHANGPLEAGGIQAITTAATAPLSHLLAAGRRGRVQPDGENLFAHLPDTYPRAWACLTAVADTIGPGGRGTYRAPTAPSPSLPNPDELVDTPAAAGDDRISVMSAIDPRLDQRLAELLKSAAYDGVLLWVSALSRISRNLDKLFRALEFLTAHDATILTTNYMIRNGDVWVRQDVSSNQSATTQTPACTTPPVSAVHTRRPTNRSPSRRAPQVNRRPPEHPSPTAWHTRCHASEANHHPRLPPCVAAEELRVRGRLGYVLEFGDDQGQRVWEVFD